MRGLRPPQRRRLATSVLDDLRRVFRAVRISARRAEQDLGISGAQLFVLQKLADRPAGSLNELAERTLTHQTSVSVVVQRLVQRGLVGRDRAEDDRRRIELRLTSAGRRLLRRAVVTPQAELVKTIQSMQDRELQQVARLMHQLAKAVHAARLTPELLFAEREDGRVVAETRSAGRKTQRRRTRVSGRGHE